MMMYMPFSGEECADTSLGEIVFDIFTLFGGLGSRFVLAVGGGMGELVDGWGSLLQCLFLD